MEQQVSDGRSPGEGRGGEEDGNKGGKGREYWGELAP